MCCGSGGIGIWDTMCVLVCMCVLDSLCVLWHSFCEVLYMCVWSVCICVCARAFSTGRDVPRMKTVEGGGLQDSLKLPGGT